jgi:hypothetical protein
MTPRGLPFGLNNRVHVVLVPSAPWTARWPGYGGADFIQAALRRYPPEVALFACGLFGPRRSSLSFRGGAPKPLRVGLGLQIEMC